MDLMKVLFVATTFFGVAVIDCRLHSVACSSVERTAVRQADTILSMGHQLGLTRQQLIEACRYIQQQNASSPRIRGKRLSRPKLPCVIEKLRHPSGFVIRSLPGKGAHIGRGFHKVVSKAIFFDPEPRIIAHCDGDPSSAEEIKALKRLQGCRGIVSYLGYVARPNNRYSIFLDFYPLGSLQKVAQIKRCLTAQQLLKISKDLIIGLHSMHKKGLIHRDLHFGNILLKEEPKGLISAVLADFGQTKKNFPSTRFLPQISRVRNPPEILLFPSKQLDWYKADVYGLGCTLYKLLWNRQLPWEVCYDAEKIPAYSSERRKKIYALIVSMYKRDKQERLNAKQPPLLSTRLGRVRALVFDMLHFDPKHRPTTAALVRRINSVVPD